MIRRPWLESGRESAVRQAALAPLDAVASIYRLGAFAHRACWERGLRTPRRLPCCVIGVGSPVVGGAGKTPMTAWIAAQLARRGLRVAIASRGYGRRGRDPVSVVSDGRQVHAMAEEAGDEPMVLVAHAPGVPVLVGGDRGIVGLRAVSAFGIDALVLDDALQHHRVVRDVEIATFDGQFGLGNRRVLPRGPLREGIGALARVQAIGVLDPPLEPDAERLLSARAPEARRFEARRQISKIRSLSGEAFAAPESLAGTEVGMLAGIAQPASLRRTLEGLGARVVAERIFRDHHRYRARDMRGLRARTPIWVTTEKDAVKILPAWMGALDIRVLVMDLEVDGEAELLDWLVRRVEEVNLLH